MAFQRAYSLHSLEDISRYFSDSSIVLYQSEEILRNLVKVALASYLPHFAESLIHQDRSEDEFAKMLRHEADAVLNISVKQYPEDSRMEQCLPNARAYVEQVIHKIVKRYRQQRQTPQKENPTLRENITNKIRN